MGSPDEAARRTAAAEAARQREAEEQEAARKSETEPQEVQARTMWAEEQSWFWGPYQGAGGLARRRQAEGGGRLRRRGDDGAARCFWMRSLA